MLQLVVASGRKRLRKTARACVKPVLASCNTLGNEECSLILSLPAAIHAIWRRWPRLKDRSNPLPLPRAARARDTAPTQHLEGHTQSTRHSQRDCEKSSAVAGCRSLVLTPCKTTKPLLGACSTRSKNRKALVESRKNATRGWQLRWRCRPARVPSRKRPTTRGWRPLSRCRPAPVPSRAPSPHHCRRRHPTPRISGAARAAL